MKIKMLFATILLLALSVIFSQLTIYYTRKMAEASREITPQQASERVAKSVFAVNGKPDCVAGGVADCSGGDASIAAHVYAKIPTTKQEQWVKQVGALLQQEKANYSDIPKEIKATGPCHDISKDGWKYFCDYYDHNWARRKECGNDESIPPSEMFGYNMSGTCVFGREVEDGLLDAAGGAFTGRY